MAHPRPRSWAIRLYRLVLVACAFALIHVAGQHKHDGLPEAHVDLADVRRIFPDAVRLEWHSPPIAAYSVFSADDEPLGTVRTTSPQADHLRGYSGPSNLLVGLSPDGAVVAVQLLASDDTPAHVAEILRDQDFWQQFTRWTVSEQPTSDIDAVSGSTLTSWAMAEAVQQTISGIPASFRFPEPLTLPEVQRHFPAANLLIVDIARPGWVQILDAAHQRLGYALRTSPTADNIIGYAGPTETWLAIAPDQQTVQAIYLRASYDTPDYVSRIADDTYYLRKLTEFSLAEWAELDFSAAGIEGVSGATQTSFAIAEGIRRHIQTDQQRQQTQRDVVRARWRDTSLLIVVLGAIVIGYSRLRGIRWLRIAWQCVLIVGFGLWLGDLLSLALFAGWARAGIPWATTPVFVLLGVIALLAPWGTRRQIYCHYTCPHGAAQEWLSRHKRFHLSLSPRFHRVLTNVPWLLLAIAFVLGIVASAFDLTQLEPFDAWSLKWAAGVSALIAITGLIASLFVPMAYCRFGCPSGALFKLIQSHGSNERFRFRDGAATGLLILMTCYVGLSRAAPSRELHSYMAAPDHSAPRLQIAGQGFGTVWNVQFRAAPRDFPQLREELSQEVLRIENQLSHWRPASETSQFNGSRTTFAMEFSPELVQLVSHGQALSQRTAGAFDLTVSPLVNAWGFGPAGPVEEPPQQAEIDELLQRVGWQQIVVDIEANTLRKLHPDVQLDLGALLQGYAADQLAHHLDQAGVEQYLIEVGGEFVAKGTWNVAIENPLNPAAPLRVIQLQDAALATSGIYRPDTVTGATHIVDPHSGRPVTSRWQLCAVIAPSGLEAEGWATALLASSAAAQEVAEEYEVASLWADREGQIAISNAGQPHFASAKD